MRKGIGRRLRQIPWPVLAASLPCLVLLVVILHFFIDYVSDDAFISFRYADHLASGKGLEWNPGYRVEGYSNFLWVVALAGLKLLGMPIPLAGQVLSWLAALGSVLMIVVIARREQRAPCWTLLVLAPLPMVVSFPYQWWAVMRLETPMMGALLLLGVLLFVREEEGHRVRRWPSALAYLALVMLRPEGAAYVAIPGIYLLSGIRSRADLRRVLRERWLWAAIVVVGALAYHLWRWSYFGELLPNTYYAKVGDEVLAEGWSYLRRFATSRPYYPLLAAAALLVGSLASRAGALLMGTVLMLVAVVVAEGGDWMREYRFFIPATPLLAAGLGIGLQRLAAAGASVRISAIAGMIVLCVGMQWNMGTPWSEWSRAFDWERRDLLINMEGELTVASKKAGLWLRNNARPGDLVAVNHAGAVPFYSRLPTLDMAGLNDLHVARIPGWVHSKWDPDYVMRRKPAFVVLNTHAYPAGGRYVPGYWQGETALFLHPDFQRYYEAVNETWSWRSLAMTLRENPAAAATSYIMIFRREENRYRQVGPCLDFESGTYDNWTVSGEAFGEAPADGPRRPQRLSGMQGRYLANSFPGRDEPQGMLRSAAFTIVGDNIELLVAGGADQSRVGVRLLVGGRTVREACGRNDEKLRVTRWDVEAFKGREAVVEIYDNSSGPWGVVLADAICQYVKVPIDGPASAPAPAPQPPPMDVAVPDDAG